MPGCHACHSRNPWTHLAVLLTGLFIFNTDVAAQTNTGEISGIVRDAQGGALPGARVVAEHVDSGVNVEFATDDEGRYHLLSLRLGTYSSASSSKGSGESSIPACWSNWARPSASISRSR